MPSDTTSNTGTSTPLSLHVVTVAWNEEDFLPHFLDYYAQLGADITVYDNESTDHTPDIVEAFPQAELRTLATGSSLRDDENSRVKATGWLNRPATDWVLCVDADELLFHPHLHEYLRACDAEGIDVIVPYGYDMTPGAHHESSPREQLIRGSARGAPNALYSKPVLFSARRIETVAFGPGAHAAQFSPEPTVRGDIGEEISAVDHFPSSLVFQRGNFDGITPQLLHYRFWDKPKALARWSQMESRRSDVNRQYGFGSHYEMSAHEVEKYLGWVNENSVPIAGSP